MKRTHYNFYVDEMASAPIKEYFKYIDENLKDFREREVTLGDLGCAVGLLPNYLSNQYKSFKVIGYEFSNELLSAAKKKYPRIEFNKLDVTNMHQLPPKSLDIITMSGVLSIFDDYEAIIKNCLTWIKPSGRILIFNMFNPFDLDVFIKYKHANEPFGTELESGFNIVSQKSISKVIESFGSYKFEFKEFKISMDLLMHQSDQVRSWTEKNALGQRFIINGLNIKQPLYLLKIDC